MTEKKNIVTTDERRIVASELVDGPPIPSVEDAEAALEHAIGELTKGTPGLWCFVQIPVGVGVGVQSCGRPRLKSTDVCCTEHWKLVPSKLRREMNEANKIRSEAKRERACLLVADKIMDHLAAQFVQFPPVQPIARDEPRIIRPGEVAKPDSTGVITPKIILPR
jgi:hypothetical protein